LNKVRVVEKDWATDKTSRKWVVEVKGWFFWYEVKLFLYSKEDAIDFAKNYQKNPGEVVVYETTVR
jgi:hypothetical protein